MEVTGAGLLCPDHQERERPLEVRDTREAMEAVSQSYTDIKGRLAPAMAPHHQAHEPGGLPKGDCVGMVLPPLLAFLGRPALSLVRAFKHLKESCL